MDPNIRPSWLQRTAPLLVTGGVLGLGFVALTAWRACDRREAAHRAERARAADERDDALASRILARLRPLATASTIGVPATCPPSVAGSLELIEQPFLAWLAGGRDHRAHPGGGELHTPGFAYLVGSMTPAWDSSAGFDERNRRYQALASGAYVAVLIATARPITAGSGATFDGGTVDGDLAIGDLGTGRFVCAAHVSSAATFVISVGQSSASSEASARAFAERAALVRAFRETATAELARIARGATLAF